MQVLYLPTDDRFFVRLPDEAVALYPDGAFSAVSNYPVYAMRVYTLGDDDMTEFFIPGSDNIFYWVHMSHTYLARR